MHKENAALSKVRPLLARLTGDHTWASCEMFLSPEDSEYFDARYMSRLYKRRIKDVQHHKGNATKTNGTGAAEASIHGASSHPANGAGSSSQEHDTGDQDVQMADSEPMPLISQEEAESSRATGTPVLSQNRPEPAGHEAEPSINGDQLQPQETEHINGDAESQKSSKAKGKEVELRPDPGDEDVVMEDVAGPSVNGGLESQARRSQSSANDFSAFLELLGDESFIHPMFIAPKAAHPDRDLGLPKQEAEDVRRLLQLYVQKQEEVCRGTKRLYEGLLKADRRRKTVLEWAKAEAHCGPNRDMSDGEDWYDQKEWGLTEDIKKGQDEEEEDTTQTQKKTRNRGK